jgi:hypothetical protein
MAVCEGPGRKARGKRILVQGAKVIEIQIAKERAGSGGWETEICVTCVHYYWRGKSCKSFCFCWLERPFKIL